MRAEVCRHSSRDRSRVRFFPLRLPPIVAESAFHVAMRSADIEPEIARSSSNRRNTRASDSSARPLTSTFSRPEVPAAISASILPGVFAVTFAVTESERDAGTETIASRSVNSPLGLLSESRNVIVPLVTFTVTSGRVGPRGAPSLYEIIPQHIFEVRGLLFESHLDRRTVENKFTQGRTIASQGQKRLRGGDFRDLSDDAALSISKCYVI